MELRTLSRLQVAEERSLLFLFSAFMFRLGLGLATFEQVRPFFGMQVSDYCFFLSLGLLLHKPKSRLLEIKGSGVLLAGSLIVSGALLGLRNSSSLGDAAGPIARMVTLFGLFAPLALIHSKDIRKNMLFLAGGIFVNCTIAWLQAWVFPGITTFLSVNAAKDDLSDSGRFQALTTHPNVLGLSAALAVLIGLGLLFSERRTHVRAFLYLLVFVSTVGALLSGSRTFFIALAAGLIVFALSQKLYRGAVVRSFVTIAVLWGALNYLAPNLFSEYSERLGSTGAEFAPDYGRYISAALAVIDISQKPIVGWGPDHFDDGGVWLNPLTGEEAGVHNSFLMYWRGAGLLGATGFLALFLIPVRRMLGLLKQNLPRDHADAVRLALACCGLLFVVSNVQPILYNRFLFVPIFIFAGFAARLHALVKTRSGTSTEAMVHLTPTTQPAT
jgi:O-antigen ligase